MSKKIKYATFVVAFLLVLVSGYGIYVYQSVKSTAHHIYEERKPLPSIPVSVNSGVKDKKKNAVDPEKLDPFTVLVLGVDERANDRGRSDSMILLAVNPAKESILMFNIPRDTRTTIVGHGMVDKINHAFAFGGVDMSIQTVEEFLQYPINYYLKVNMEGFSRIIDSLGGVDVNNPFSFDYEGYQFTKGEIHLNGSEALAFSRMRFEDPRGDLGRNERQREILLDLISKSLNVSTVFKLESILDEIGTSVKTDISFDEMKSFMLDYRTKLNRIEQVEVKGRGEKINGVWYYIVSDEQRDEISSLLKVHME
ncbi:LCP family protein [Paenibacillus sp. EC2-1]|uniref:LCP family glycopolymer transferase n=1 Tax=Paenibacillus sp. EC2-1 TaxID=3388665 RepID=UPI003BEEEA3D